MLKPSKRPFTPRKAGPRTKYPWASMKLHTSFIIPARSVLLRSIAAYACVKGRALSRRFRVAELEDGSIQVYREK